MAINLKGDKKPRELIQEGSYAARIYSIVEIGHVDGEYQGTPKIYHQIRLTWELPDECREFQNASGTKEMKPLVIGSKYTISMAPKSNLRPIIEGIMGAMTDDEAENFDIKHILGKECLLAVAHKTSKAGNKYNVVASTAKLPKGMTCKEQFNDSVYLDWSDFDQEVFDKLPQFIREDMTYSHEYKDRFTPKDEDLEVMPHDKDGVPF